VKKRINTLRKKKKRNIIGIETGNSPDRLGAAVVEVSGSGDETVIDLRGFNSHAIPRDLLTTFTAFDQNQDFDSEEIAGMNFLVTHHISNLYLETMEELALAPEDIDLIGLKCIEIGGLMFPGDPAIVSEMTGRIVASRFGIGPEKGDGVFLPLSESLLQGMLGDMIEKFGLENEVREAVAVAVIANESLFHESSELCGARGSGSEDTKRPSLRAVKRTGVSGRKGKAVLCGEFFFPE
jgi:hypothetical protein